MASRQVYFISQIRPDDAQPRESVIVVYVAHGPFGSMADVERFMGGGATDGTWHVYAASVDDVTSFVVEPRVVRRG